MGKNDQEDKTKLFLKNSSYILHLINAIFWSTCQQTKPAMERFQRVGLKMLSWKILFFSACDLDICLEHTLRRAGHVYV